jgi:2-polyprenyl-6-hydroxyphenyl methylase / 3-demethylubiquinone-9 3-methyltransferase
VSHLSAAGTASVFDDFPWWGCHDVLTHITPARFAYISAVAGEMAGRKVLDIGCGGGLLAELLARCGATVTGIDICRPALRVAHEHALSSGLDVGYVRAAAEGLPFSDGEFDTAVAFDVLEHVDDLTRAIAEVARVLRSGGTFMYDTMNRTQLCRMAVIWIGESVWPGGPPKGTHDWRKFIKPGALAAELAQHGIDNVETKGFHPVGVDRRGRLKMALSPFKGLSYVGYGIKRRV